jgi:serine/threonine protein kinase
MMVQSFALQIFEELKFLHSIGVTHTDLKVMLSNEITAREFVIGEYRIRY